MATSVSVISLSERKEFNHQKNTKQSVKTEDNTWQDILEHITTVVHVLSLGLAIYVLYLCFLNPFTLVTWHVFLYTLGWSLLMSEGILFVIKENIFTKRLSQPTRVRMHWISLMLATALIIGGFGTIVENRAQGDGNHFSTEHGLSGLIATTFGFIATINGLPALHNVRLRKFISPNLNKFCHAFMGFATIVAGAYATITGYYVGWFRNRSSENMQIVCFVVTVIIVVWTTFRPILNGYTRIKNMLN